MSSIASFSGIASGIQWRDMIDQIMAAEEIRRLGPIHSQLKAQQSRSEAWNAFQGAVAKLRASALKLQDGSAFGANKLTVGNGAAAGRPPLSASASSAAQPGSYQVEVRELARAEKLSGDVFASATEALGAAIAGSFLVNGARIDLTGTDTLNSVRDKINAANSGSSPTRVTATVLSTGPNAHRLVLTSDATGAAGIELVNVDGAAADPLRELGLTDGALVANTAADGLTQSRRFASSSEFLETVLGVSPPPAQTSLSIAGVKITVDFETDSLASIHQKIIAQGVHAELREERAGGTTAHRLVVAGEVRADASLATPEERANSQRAVELLGFLEGGRSAVAQQVTGGAVLTNSAAGGAPADLGARLTDLRAGGAAGLAIGESILVRGTRADGTAVNLSFRVETGEETVGDLLAAIDGAYGGSATASIGADGRIQLTAAAAGESQLSLSLSTSDGGLALGTTAIRHGRSREVVRGSDAAVVIDGVLFSRSSNTIGDALAGVTLNLQEADRGNPVALSIARDTDSIVGAVKSFATEYNAVLDFVKKQTAPGGAMANNGAIKGAMSTLTNTLLTDVVGLASAYNRGTLVGVSLSKTGTLEVDEAKLKELLASNPNDVRALFASNGTTSDGALTYIAGGDATRAGSYTVQVAEPATRAGHTGSGLGATYAGSHSLTVRDAFSGKSVEIADLAGKSAAELRDELNALFAAGNLRLSASVIGGQLRLEGTEYGSAASFTLDGSYDEAQLGFTRGTAYAGTDIQGTIDGETATGRGQLLTSAPDASSANQRAMGVAVRYTGAATGEVGTVTYALGLGGMMARATDALTRSGDGLITTQTSSIQTSIESLGRRADDVQARLDLRRESLIRQFAAMEAAMSRMQSQSNWLASQIQGLASWSQSK